MKVAKIITAMILLAGCFQNSAFSQSKNHSEENYAGLYGFSIQESASDFSGIKELDSLIKIPCDLAIIKYKAYGDITVRLTYERLFFEGNEWNFDSSYNFHSRRLVIVPDSLITFNNPQFSKHVMVFRPSQSTAQDYCDYVVVIKNKVVKSLGILNGISDYHKNDPALINEFKYFEGFDRYITSIRRPQQ